MLLLQSAVKKRQHFNKRMPLKLRSHSPSPSIVCLINTTLFYLLCTLTLHSSSIILALGLVIFYIYVSNFIRWRGEMKSHDQTQRQLRYNLHCAVFLDPIFWSRLWARCTLFQGRLGTIYKLVVDMLSIQCKSAIHHESQPPVISLTRMKATKCVQDFVTRV